MVHPFSTPPPAAAAIPPTVVVEEASSLETDRRLPTRILIADDSSMNRLVDVCVVVFLLTLLDTDAQNRKILRRMLESSTNEAALGEVIVEEADNGSTAIQALREATLLIPPRLHHNHQVEEDYRQEDDVDGDRNRDAAGHKEDDGDVWMMWMQSGLCGRRHRRALILFSSTS